jgi:hypothetical protein
MDKLEGLVQKRDKEEERLKKTIVALVKEYYRLSGKTCYEPTTPELDSIIKGGDG